ncbi:hypothetical protein B0T26DRAFT_758194 [Lasiosphaeria miniovina]|uniref:Uncharacterized protein n=1 Tax=Lasiosphaeria miniovina TaxID=1954250 RepID=A0AA40EC71_9PEZI|nr:uncharacterized protein B0T26DRAFT_758194 [Lasiosphaeria miniovina]KAK0732922.1 hypothetical protein B0T26DRAFT_758194 [Lasiosphaeria miniovina]
MSGELSLSLPLYRALAGPFALPRILPMDCVVCGSSAHLDTSGLMQSASTRMMSTKGAIKCA